MERRVKLGDIVFSVIEDEKPRDMVAITDNTVESGQDVSDHVKQESSIIDIAGVMIGEDAASNLQKLRRYQREGKLLKYIGRNIYDNMLIQTIDRDHGKSISNGFAYNITLKQVRISTAEKVEIKVVNPATKEVDKKVATKVKTKVNNGKQQPQKKAVRKEPTPAKQQIASMGIYQGGMSEQATSLVNLTKIRNTYKAPQDRKLGIYQGGIV